MMAHTSRKLQLEDLQRVVTLHFRLHVPKFEVLLPTVQSGEQGVSSRTGGFNVPASERKQQGSFV